MTMDLIRASGAQVWRPRPPVKLSDWVEQNVRLSPEWEATPGRYNLRDNPFWREPLDAFLDPYVRHITVMKSTQVGGTLLLIAANLGLSKLDPAPAMLLGPDQDYAQEVRDRTYATAEESPSLRGDIPSERLRNLRSMDIAGSRIYLAWSGSPQRVRGRPCKRVYRTEIDVFKRDAGKGGRVLKASGERVKRFPDSTIYDESSPDGEESDIAAGYDAGHRAKWMCPCPHCGTYQEFHFYSYRDGPKAGFAGWGGLKDESGNYLSPEEVVKTAHYVCKEGCRIESYEKDRMVRGGAWVAEGQTITPDGQVLGEPARGRRHVSYHIWSVHSPTITLADIAVAFLEHRRDGALRDFAQNWLGQRVESRKRLPEWHILGKRLSLGYSRRLVPAGVWFLTAGCDVQLDGCYYVIRGWADACTSYLVEQGYLPRYDVDSVDLTAMSEEELNRFFRSDLRQLTDAVVNRHFPMQDGLPNPLGKRTLRPRIVGIDSQHRTREVHAFVGQHDERRVRAVRGDHKTKPQDRFRLSLVERPARDGPAYASPRPVWNIFTPHYKEALQEKLLLPAGIPGSFNFYANVVQQSADYLRQLTNERPTEIIDARTGRKSTLFKPRHDAWGNHYGDCEVYGFAMAEVLLYELDFSWDAKDWPIKPKTPVSPHREIDAPSAAVRSSQL